jgi:5-formyltetrahydrofolate cyclo-ligase
MFYNIVPVNEVYMVSESKAVFRKKLLTQRDAISDLDREVSAREIAGRLNSMDEYRDARIVAFYMAKGSEVSTLHLIAESFSRGKQVLLPVVEGENLHFHYFTSFHEMTEGKFGVLEPINKEKVTVTPQVIIVPGLAFDKDLHRLGYGKGYYDRFLAKLKKTAKTFCIGLCYEAMLVEELPKHEHDQQMDAVVTETKVLRR